MGRDKDKGLRKAKPSASSASAAAMVAAMGGGGTGLTFAAFDPNASAVDADLDADIGLALKKLSKRDPTTKIKALAELSAFFDESGGRTEDEIALALPQWQLSFDTVAMDPDRRVREGLFTAHTVLASRVKKQMTKHLKSLMLPWLCGRFDPESSVRSAANSAFAAMFPPHKVPEAFFFCRADILRGVQDNIAQSVQTLCDPKIFSKEEADETYGRVISSSLLALAHVLDAVSKEQAHSILSGSDVLSQPAFWKLGVHSSVHIRAAMYTLTRSISLRSPSSIHDDAAPDASKLKQAASMVFGGLGDKDPAAHVQMWEAVLVLAKTFPASLTVINLSKAVLPRLWSLIKSGAHGSAASSFPCVVPFLDLCWKAMPDEEGARLHAAALESVWAAGEETHGRAAKEAAVTCYFECLLDGLHKSIAKHSSSSSSSSSSELPLLSASAGLSPCVAAVLSAEESAYPKAALQSGIVRFLQVCCSHADIAAQSAPILAAFASALRASPAMAQPAACSSKDGLALAGLLCAFDAAHAAAPTLAAVPAEVCAALLPACEKEGTAVPVQMALLSTVCAVAKHWGLAVVLDLKPTAMAAGATVDRAAAAAVLLDTKLIPLVSRALGAGESEGGGEGGEALGETQREMLQCLFELVLLDLSELEAPRNGWDKVLSLVVGAPSDSDADAARLPEEGTRLEALALLLSACCRSLDASSSSSSASVTVEEWRSARLDGLVLAAARRLAQRRAEEEEPGMLLAARLRALVLAALARLHPPSPPSATASAPPPWRKDSGLLSAGALEELQQLLVAVVGAWSQRADPPWPSTTGPAARAATLDVVESVMAGWLERQAAGAEHLMLPLAGAVFAMTAHSEHTQTTANAECPPYDHGEEAGARLRSRQGLRAAKAWDACGREVLVAVLAASGGAAEWVEGEAGRLVAEVREAQGVGRGLVLADQASQLLQVAEASGMARMAALKLLLRRDERAWSEQASGAARQTWLAFALRLTHHHSKSGGAQGRAVLGVQDGVDLELVWVLEELVLAHAECCVLQMSDVGFGRASGWGFEDDGQAEAAVELEQVARDVRRAWDQTLAQIVLAVDEGGGGVGIAELLVGRALERAMGGDGRWARMLLHMLVLLAQRSVSRCLSCAEALIRTLLQRPKLTPKDGRGTALGALAMVRALAPILRASEEAVAATEVGEQVVYVQPDGALAVVELLAVHKEEYPYFYSIRMDHGHEKQTEGGRLQSRAFLQRCAVADGAGREDAEAKVVGVLGRLRAQVAQLLRSSAEFALAEGKAIASKSAKDQRGTPAPGVAVLSLVLSTLSQASWSGLHTLSGSDDTSQPLWLAVLSCSCGWFASAPAQTTKLPGPEAVYMIAATQASLIAPLEQTTFSLQSSVCGFWLAQLSATPDGSCVREVCKRGAAWGQLAASLQLWLVSQEFWGTRLHVGAIKLLVLCDKYAVDAPTEGGEGGENGESQADAAAQEEEEEEVLEIDDDDEEEVLEVLDDDDEEEAEEAGGGSKSSGGRGQGWAGARRSGFAQVLGELMAASYLLADLSAKDLAHVHTVATAAAEVPVEVLALELVHLHKKKRVAICAGLHGLLAATDAVVQVSAFTLLSRFYLSAPLLRHLDALAWEGVQRDQELESDEPSSPAPSAEALADAFRALPKRLVEQADASSLPAKEAVMSTESLGVMLAWKLLLGFRLRCPTRLQGNISTFLRQRSLLPPLLTITFAHISMASDDGDSLGAETPLHMLPDLTKLNDEDHSAAAMSHLSGHLFYSCVQSFPTIVRLWYNDLDRGTAIKVERFATDVMSPLLLAKEISVIQESSLDEEELNIRGSTKSREITAAYTKDDAVLEIVLKVPPAYPLRAVEVDGTRRVGVSEGKWKKWALSMRTLLDHKDGSLLDAVLLWKKNVDQVFEGVEECPICYTVIHLVNNTLPRLSCHTCRNKFHSACLYKWFNTSNKSTCPLCQSPWYS